MRSSNGNIFRVTGHLCWGIRRSPVNSPHKSQRRGALMLSLICAWMNAGVNNYEAGDLRRHCAHYDVTVMIDNSMITSWHGNAFGIIVPAWAESIGVSFVVYLKKSLNKQSIRCHSIWVKVIWYCSAMPSIFIYITRYFACVPSMHIFVQAHLFTARLD